MADLPTLVSWVDTRSVLVFLLTFLVGILVTSTRRRPRLPPGPQKWPLIGNLPQMFMSMRKYQSQFKMFQEFSKQYGGIYTLSPGRGDMILVTDFKLIREVLLDRAEEFNERPCDRLLKALYQENGILFASGEKWKAIRKFTTVAFRDFGVGSRTLEHIIQEEAAIVCDAMATEGKPFQPKQLLSDAVANVICNIIFGNRFEYDDDDFHMILDKMEYMAKNVGPTTIDNFLPFLKYLPIDTPGKKLIRNREILRKYTYKRIDEHRASFDTNNIRDYIDLYIKVSDEGSESSALTEPHLFQAILDLYFAGAETTAASMDWFILFMIVYPEIQEKCRQEIDKVVGNARKVGMQDKEDLPFVNATILELQRIANVVPFTIPHKNAEQAELGGYMIPKGSVILPLIMSPHMNDEYFERPDEFRPGRWLSKDNKVIKIDQHIPFGLGPHRCLGENLAKMEIFLFVTNFLQRYIFEVPEGQPNPSMEGVHTGITLNTKPYEITMKKRW